jgi:hypothetical protein
MDGRADRECSKKETAIMQRAETMTSADEDTDKALELVSIELITRSENCSAP